MPLYEYKCPKCGKIKEILQKGYDNIKPICKLCLATKEEIIMKRIISRNGFQLKGDGWYKDHYGLKEKK